MVIAMFTRDRTLSKRKVADAERLAALLALSTIHSLIMSSKYLKYDTTLISRAIYNHEKHIIIK